MEENTQVNEKVNHPSHYNLYPIETIKMMEAIWGREKTRDWCIMTAFKYRMRLGMKDNIDQDLAKERFYLDYAKQLEREMTPLSGTMK